MAQTINPEEILNLAYLLRAGENISPMQSQPPGQIPTGEYPNMLDYRWDNSDPGRYTPDFLSPEGQYIRDALNINRDTQPLQVATTPTQPPTAMQPRPVSQPNATPTGDEMPQPIAENKQSGYEDYLKLFEKTLGDKPELDTKKRNQLAPVALINSLGQALRQVVDFTGKSKYGSPINPQQDNLTPGLLAQYEKESQDYQQRKDRYDLQKTNTMQQALQYAYGDEKAKDQYEKQLDLLGRQQEFSAAQTDKELGARKDLYGAQVKNTKDQYDQQVRDQVARDEKLHGYDMEKLRAAKTAADKVVGDELKLAGENVPVIDQKTGQPLVIPKELYWDVYQKIMNNPSDQMKQMMMGLEGATYEQSKQIVGGMIASEYRKFYEPQYDTTGKFEGWRMVDPNAAAQPKEYKTFWDLPGMTTPGVPLPSAFTPKTK